MNRRMLLGAVLLAVGAIGALAMVFPRIDITQQRTLYAGGSAIQSQVVGCQLRPQLNRVTLDKAVELAERHVDSLGNPNLAVREVMEFESNFYFIVYEKSTGTGAFEMLIDPYSGGVRPEPGPNMMWNSKYGMMSSMNRAGMMRGERATTVSSMSVAAARAEEIVAGFLKTNLPGATVEEPDVFYGYYTFHILKDGKIYGMLSVNGYTEQIWYHSWHGAFIAMKELD